MKRIARYSVLLTISLGIVGCGDGRPARVPVAGQVLIDGKPLTRGIVKFVSASGRPAIGDLDAEGRFRLSCYEPNDGAIPGSYKVSVTSAEGLGPDATRWYAPKKYSDYRTSGLAEEIKGPVDNLTIKISWEGGHEYVEREPGAGGAASDEKMPGRRKKN